MKTMKLTFLPSCLICLLILSTSSSPCSSSSVSSAFHISSVCLDPEESVYKQTFDRPGEFDADIKAAKNHHEEKSEEKYKKNDDKK